MCICTVLHSVLCDNDCTLTVPVLIMPVPSSHYCILRMLYFLGVSFYTIGWESFSDFPTIKKLLIKNFRRARRHQLQHTPPQAPLARRPTLRSPVSDGSPGTPLRLSKSARRNSFTMPSGQSTQSETAAGCPNDPLGLVTDERQTTAARYAFAVRLRL